ncbi:ectoine/hydroxyectoine ABC transporter permease subunit EhuD [Candidatus Formimonas warabiya]|uniref:Ectoine/hydroxyectoine ABC transporter permease subunit EhuD n=1 Tax=Formimonas warabiya TaxID=1761012 RepID=A0A3G1KX38_FORW1|nr:ectoine/hydroxyectoine ABC transporter permease subunit EhuD [Candidatus Formimonas warabiya]ATW27044.1 ectoine/hydroxyectoine ABC transporter permease subunit EhuD [Candidatus Formimonas warabiya]
MWDWQFVSDILPELVKTLKITISATFAGFFLACILGIFLTLGRRAKFKPVSLATGGFVEFVRSTPLLAQLYFIFYVFPLHGLTLSPFAAGVLGLGIHYSTYLSEVYRSGIEAIPRGQWEAAAALNFSKLRTWINIILPQAIPPVVPVMGNYLIGMFKDTPLLSAITLVELLQMAKIIGSRTFRYMEPITLVGVFFLILSYVSSLGVQHLERRLNRR